MQRRTTVLFALVSTSCFIAAPIGGLPGSDGDGSATSVVFTDTSDDAYSSAPGDDGAGTTTVPVVPETTTDDGGDTLEDSGEEASTGDAVCVRDPSGYEPGEVLWTTQLDIFVPADLATARGDAWLVGSVQAQPLFVHVSADGVNVHSQSWEIPGADFTLPRFVVAPPGERIFAGFQTEGDCFLCVQRWVVAFSDEETEDYSMFLGQGPWGLAPTAAGGFVMAGGDTPDGDDYTLHFTEYDADGAIVASMDPIDDDIAAYVRGTAASGGTGFSAFGEAAVSDDGVWEVHWDSASGDALFAANTTQKFAMARTPGGDVVDVIVGAVDPDITWVLRRSPAEGLPLWETELPSDAIDLAVDCDDGIVIAGELLERRDGDGLVQWSTDLGAWNRAVAIDDDGFIYTVLETEGGATVARVAAF